MSSHTPSLALAMPSMALGRLGVTSPGTAWTVAHRKGHGKVCVLAVCTSPGLPWCWQHPGGEVQCYAVSGQRTRALWRPLSSQKIKGDKCPQRTELQSQGEKALNVLAMGSALRNSPVQQWLQGCSNFPLGCLHWVFCKQKLFSGSNQPWLQARTCGCGQGKAEAALTSPACHASAPTQP